jgi:hypothetical protein
MTFLLEGERLQEAAASAQSCMRTFPSFPTALRRIAFIFAAFFGCLASPLIAADEEDWPMNQGDEWVFDVVMVLSDDRKFNATCRSKIGAKVERNGKTYHSSKMSIEGGPFPFESLKLLRKDEKGLYSLDPRNPDATEQTEIVLPLKVGQTWEHSEGLYRLKTEVIGLEKVVIGGKTYDKCYSIRTSAANGGYVEDYWAAPGVGTIKSEMVQEGARFSLTLREFKRAKP